MINIQTQKSPYDEKIWLKSYDKHVPHTLDYPNKSLGKLFDKAMERFPNRVACYFMKKEILFEELRDKVHRFATFLQQNGLQKGDRVAISLPNCPQYMIAHFGAIFAGGVASGCSPLLSATELAYQINDSESKFFVTLDAIYEKVVFNILEKVPSLKSIITTNISDYMGLGKLVVSIAKLIGKIPKGKVKPFPGKQVIDFQEVLEIPPDINKMNIDIKNDLALLQYTGGTTGLPKGTELTHFNIISNIHQIVSWIGIDIAEEGRIHLSAFPMFHLAGLQMSMTTLYISAPQILIVNPRDTKHIIEEIIDKLPKLMVNVPTLYLSIKSSPLIDKVPENALNNLDVYISGAAPFPAEAIRDFEKVMKAENKVMEVYGMTETSPILTGNPYYGIKKIGTVGLPVADTEIRLVDIETGEQVELGKPGEIICRGPQVTRGYYNKPEDNAKTIIDGWFHTGDVGIMDKDGYITIVDRTKDMLIVSGYKVYSVHVEGVLTKHPDIKMIAIIGLSDPNRPGSETVKAIIQLKEGVQPSESTKDKLKKYAAEHLSKYETPKIWEFRETLPLTAVGKVLKRALREESSK